MASKKALVKISDIERRILLVRGEKVIVDADLAAFYGVSTRRLNEQVKRNRNRFPGDFVFQLTPEEKSEVIANCDHLSRLKYSKVPPHAFTEHGAIMAANVINCSRAVEMSVFVVRAFVRMRRTIADHAELAKRISQLERRSAGHDEDIRALIKLVKGMISSEPVPKRRRIGFARDDS
jgi:hypothetical protein